MSASVLVADGYCELVHHDDDAIYIASVGAPSGSEWQLTVPRDFAVDLLTQIARGIAREDM